jgi:hypothetical protein
MYVSNRDQLLTFATSTHGRDTSLEREVAQDILGKTRQLQHKRRRHMRSKIEIHICMISRYVCMRNTA